MVEVLDDKVKDLLVPDSYINLREEENKSHMFGAVEIRISKLQEGKLNENLIKSEIKKFLNILRIGQEARTIHTKDLDRNTLGPETFQRFVIQLFF
jgi:hypothetical protein